jgi:hypothetical protein
MKLSAKGALLSYICELEEWYKNVLSARALCVCAQKKRGLISQQVARWLMNFT